MLHLDHNIAGSGPVLLILEGSIGRAFAFYFSGRMIARTIGGNHGSKWVSHDTNRKNEQLRTKAEGKLSFLLASYALAHGCEHSLVGTLAGTHRQKSARIGRSDSKTCKRVIHVPTVYIVLPQESCCV